MQLCSQKLSGDLFHSKIFQQYPEVPIHYNLSQTQGNEMTLSVWTQ